MPPRSNQQLWTLQITGPIKFSFHLPGNPPVEHGGGTTVAHLVALPEEMAKIRGLVLLHGNRIKAWPMEGQTEEQLEERLGLNALARPGLEWPCLECPLCPWFDPYNEKSPCGRLTWPSESVATLRETSEHHREAETNCPVSLRGSEFDFTVDS